MIKLIKKTVKHCFYGFFLYCDQVNANALLSREMSLSRFVNAELILYTNHRHHGYLLLTN